MRSETLKKIKTEEPNYQWVASCLNDAERVELVIDEKKYSGEIEQWKLGEAIVYRVSNLDQELVTIPDGFSSIIIKTLGKGGVVRSYKTKILKKKLPRLLLSFPKKEIPRVKREHPRLHANLSTPIILEKRENDMLPNDRTGMGTIENVSIGGASITTQMQLKRGDTANFFLPVKSGGGTKDLDLHGQIMSLEKLDSGGWRAGMKFIRLGREEEKEITDYINRRLDSVQAII